MKDIFIIIFLIICCILLIISILKKHKFLEIDNDIIEKNKKLEIEKAIKIKELEGIEHNIKIKKEALYEAEKITRNMNAAARQAFAEYCESLEREYRHIEYEHDEAVELLNNSYDDAQQRLLVNIADTKAELAKISQTRAAAIEAQLKEQEIKDKQSFYCPQVPEMELKDAKTLRDIEYKLNNPRILRMLIWSTFYQKPMNQVCANVLGAATAEKCGIYKITNQKTDLCYIGQAVDIATRWKNHAKCGLGIDTPVNNKLYRAMQEDGLENFSFEVLEECSRAQLNEKEKFYINLYQADQFGYNSSTGINK